MSTYYRTYHSPLAGNFVAERLSDGAILAHWEGKAELEYWAQGEPEDFDWNAYEECPACGEFPDHCQGHGEIADPEGYAIIQEHYEDNSHSHCRYGAH